MIIEGLAEVDIGSGHQPLSQAAAGFIAAAREGMGSIDCFDFVPSNYELAWGALSALPPGRFCELGSGLGVAVGLAALLGYQASGIELDETLAEQSRQFLAEHQLAADILTGSYYERWVMADVYYVYSWPSQLTAVQERFLAASPPRSRLLICFGQDDIRCLMRQLDFES